MKNSKVFSQKTIKFLKLAAVFILLACGPMPFDFGEYYSLFMPESSNSPQNTSQYHYSPLFYYGTGRDFFDYDEESQNLNIADSVNVQSWISYGGTGITATMVENALLSQKASSELSKQLQKNGKSEAATYVNFAQKIDKSIPHAANPWEDTPERNETAANKLYAEALQKVQSANDVFLKERYAFQAIKLAAELEKPQEVVKNYEALITPIKQKTFISDWAWARKAGATMTLGDTAKAFYEFAQIFEKCPTRRQEADLSVRTKATNFGEKALSFCKNDAEKAAVYALWAIQPEQDGLELLKKLIAINPAHPMAELIMSREINKNEVYFFAEKNSDNYMLNLDVQDENYKPDANKIKAASDKALSYFEKLGMLAAEMTQNKQAKSPAFWFTALSYIDYLKKDYPSAQKNLESAKAAQSNNLNADVEAKLLNQIAALDKTEDFRKNNMMVKLCNDLATAYTGEKQADAQKANGWRSWLGGCSSKKEEEKQNLPNGAIKAFLAKCIPSVENDHPFMNNTSKNELTDNSSIDLLKSVLVFIKKNDLSQTDKQLIQLAHIDADYLNIALGRAYLKTKDYANAAEIFKNIDAKTWSKEPFLENFGKNPFYVLGATNTPTKSYSPTTFVQEMAALKKRTEQNPKDAEAWYLLGCGEYNMSYHGNAWILLKREWSGAEFGSYMDAKDADYYATETAKQYFKKALDAQPNAELAAKICYGGALCERNQYLLNYWKDYPQDYDEQKLKDYQAKAESTILPKYRTFFSLLRDKYRNTQYEKMVIEECSTYKSFVQ